MMRTYLIWDGWHEELGVGESAGEDMEEVWEELGDNWTSAIIPLSALEKSKLIKEALANGKI